MVVLMILRPVRMSQRAPRSHYGQCAVDQCHKPDEIHIMTGDMRMHRQSHHDSRSLYGTPDNLSTDACSLLLHDQIRGY